MSFPDNDWTLSPKSREEHYRECMEQLAKDQQLERQQEARKERKKSDVWGLIGWILGYSKRAGSQANQTFEGE